MAAIGKSASVRTNVQFYDCDPLFVVWHGRYLKYFEQARTALMQSRNFDVPEVRDARYRMFVTDARCRYLHPLSYGDEVEITAKFTALKPMIRVAYTVTNLTKNRKSARGYTVLAVTDEHGQLIPETPDDVVARLQQ